MSWTLHNGDCRTVLPEIPEGSVDLVLCDPPYGVSLGKTDLNWGNGVDGEPHRLRRHYGAWDVFSNEEEWWALIDFLFEQSFRLLTDGGHVVVWLRAEQIGGAVSAGSRWGFRERQCFFWCKPSPAPQIQKVGFKSAVEVCKWWTKGDRQDRFQSDSARFANFMIEPTPRGKERVHPAQKPIPVLETLVDALTLPGEVILDPFAGSCSTGVAALRRGRRFIGVEREDHYYQLGLGWLEAIASDRDSTAKLNRPVDQDDPVRMLLQECRSVATYRVYRAEMKAFFDGTPTKESVRAFVTQSPDILKMQLAAHRDEMLVSGKDPRRVNRRLVALRALLRVAYRMGIAESNGDGLVPNVATPCRPKVPNPAIIPLEALLALADTATEAGRRDAAILCLLAEGVASVEQVCALDTEAFRYSSHTLRVPRRNGTRTEAALSARCSEAIRRWLVGREDRSKFGRPLFCNLDHRPEHRAARLTANGVRHLVSTYGRRLGMALTPQALRPERRDTHTFEPQSGQKC